MKIIVPVRKKFIKYLMTYSKIDNIINRIPEQNNLGN